MVEWMRKNKLALIVSTSMFAVMAMMMSEALMAGEWELFGTEKPSVALWIWRLGGFLTWPVFMWLLLRPKTVLTEETTRVLGATCGIAALYGGGGLWLVSSVYDGFIAAISGGLYIITPILTIICMVLPYAYVWGFVAIYGFARERLSQKAVSREWIGTTMLAAVVGVYGIGALIYAALAAVLLPISIMLVPVWEVGSAEVAGHITLDMCAAAISIGNFASQWWAFKRLDDCFDGVPTAQGQQTTYRQGEGAPVQPPYAQEPVTAYPVGNAQAQAPTPEQPLLVCTCGAPLPVDERYLPRLIPAVRFCPSCGVQLLP